MRRAERTAALADRAEKLPAFGAVSGGFCTVSSSDAADGAAVGTDGAAVDAGGDEDAAKAEESSKDVSSATVQAVRRSSRQSRDSKPIRKKTASFVCRRLFADRGYCPSADVLVGRGVLSVLGLLFPVTVSTTIATISTSASPPKINGVMLICSPVAGEAIAQSIDMVKFSFFILSAQSGFYT